MAISQEKTPRVSVIILNYHTPDLIIHLIKSLGSDNQMEIIVVDNSSHDEISSKLSNDIQYVLNKKNLGFAGGVNKGIELAKGEWYFLLNSDTQTTSKKILELIDIAEQNNAKVAAPRLEHDGTVEKNVGYFDSFGSNPINALFARPRLIDTTNIKKPIWVDVVTGGALLIHTSVLDQIGRLDDRNFFMYFEDIDYSLRLKEKGIKILYIPSIQITHMSGGTADRDPEKKNQYYQTSLNNYMMKNRGPIISALNNVLHILK